MVKTFLGNSKNGELWLLPSKFTSHFAMQSIVFEADNSIVDEVEVNITKENSFGLLILYILYISIHLRF